MSQDFQDLGDAVRRVQLAVKRAALHDLQVWAIRFFLVQEVWTQHFRPDPDTRWSAGKEFVMVLKTIYCILVDRYRKEADAYTRSRILLDGPTLVVAAIYEHRKTFTEYGAGADWSELCVPDTFWKDWWITTRTNGYP